MEHPAFGVPFGGGCTFYFFLGYAWGEKNPPKVKGQSPQEKKKRGYQSKKKAP
jgi:hypothetical protein